MADGSITFSTKIDNTDAQKELERIERQIEKLQKDLEKSEGAKLPLVKQADELGAKLDVAKAKLADLQSQQQAVSQALSGGDPQAYIDAYAQKPTIDAAVIEQQKQVDGLQKKWDSVNLKIDNYNLKINQANSAIAAQSARAGELAAKQTAGGASMAAAMAKAQKSAALFGKRIIGIAKRVLVFSFIIKALTGIVKYLGKATKTNQEFNAQLAKLKGALLTAFQPIYETIVPALIALMRIATSVVQAVAQVFSLLSGKTAAENAKNAKALYEEANAIDEVGSSAKKASKSLAGFDEINTMGDSGDTGGGATASSTTPDFSDFSTDEYKAKIDELTVYLSGALLALGAILTFSGANIPLGIGLMVVGAVGLATEIAANWNTMSDELRGAITLVMGVLGGAALAIGAILTFSGADLPLGIGLMVAGAVALGTAVALNWNTISEMLRGPIGAVVALVSTALIAIGVILCFTGVAIPLGVALIAAGAAGLVTVVALNWNSIVTTAKSVFSTVSEWIQSHGFAMMVLGIVLLFSGFAIPAGLALIGLGVAGMVKGKDPLWNTIFEKIKEVWGKIRSFWNTNIAKYFTAKWWGDLAKGAINGFLRWIFNGINALIRRLNSFGFTLPSVLGGGRIGFNIRQLAIPQLAQGAVLPANKPFLAVVGDQKHGTNIEAPLETIKQALSEVLSAQGGSNGDININFTGDLAQLARVLKPVIDKENRRVGGDLIRSTNNG